MRVVYALSTQRAFEFAEGPGCKSKACAPPPVGTGGSQNGPGYPHHVRLKSRRPSRLKVRPGGILPGGHQPGKRMQGSMSEAHMRSRRFLANAGMKGHEIARSAEIDRAIRAIAAGKTVTVSAKQASMLIRQLGKIVLQAAKDGDEAKDYDLCYITIPGTNLFCGEHKGKLRTEMPQFGGKPVPGSKADKLPKNADGNVDATEAFERYMEGMGVKVRMQTMKASQLKASQRELIGPNVAQMMNDETFDPAAEAIYVSRDGYVIDGHHRWAAQVGRDLRDGHVGDLNLRVRMVDMNILEVIDAANAFTKDFGIMPKAAKKKAA